MTKLRLAGLLFALLGCGAAQGEAPKIRVACLDVYGTAEPGTGPKNMASWRPAFRTPARTDSSGVCDFATSVRAR